MVVIYSGTFPFDPELELKNFERKQAEYEAAYRSTREPLMLYEAMLHVRAAQQTPPDWLVTAFGDNVLQGRTDLAAERFRDRMRHVQRYRCVRDLRKKGLSLDDALDQAVAALEAKKEAAGRPTIEDSYWLVRRSLKQKHKSEFFLLVARSDPTVVPVSVIQRADGVTVINEVALSPAVTQSDA